MAGPAKNRPSAWCRPKAPPRRGPCEPVVRSLDRPGLSTGCGLAATPDPSIGLDLSARSDLPVSTALRLLVSHRSRRLGSDTLLVRGLVKRLHSTGLPSAVSGLWLPIGSPDVSTGRTGGHPSVSARPASPSDPGHSPKQTCPSLRDDSPPPGPKTACREANPPASPSLPGWPSAVAARSPSQQQRNATPCPPGRPPVLAQRFRDPRFVFAMSGGRRSVVGGRWLVVGDWRFRAPLERSGSRLTAPGWRNDPRSTCDVNRGRESGVGSRESRRTT